MAVARIITLTGETNFGSQDVSNIKDATIEGNLTVKGTTTSFESSNTVIVDKLIELGNGTTGTPSGDAGVVVERGSSDNAGLIWDESADAWVVCTTSATGASSGDLTTTPASLNAGGVTVSGDAVFDNSVNAGKDMTWDESNDSLILNDDVQLNCGSDRDLRLYHTGTHAYMNIVTGDLNIRTNSSESAIICTANAGVATYYDNSKKTETTSTGLTVEGTLDADNVTIGGAQGSDGQVLTSTGSGVAWEDASGGGGGYTVEAKSAGFTAAADYYYVIDSSSGTIAVALPNAGATASGKTIGFKARHGATNAVTLNRAAGGNIDGIASNFVMSTDMAAVELICDGTDWWIKS